MKAKNFLSRAGALRALCGSVAAVLSLGVCQAGTSLGINFGNGDRNVSGTAFGVPVEAWVNMTGASGSGDSFINGGYIAISWDSADIWHDGSLSGDPGDNDVYYEYLDDGGSGNSVTINGIETTFTNYIVQTVGSISDGATNLGPVTLTNNNQSLTYPTAQNLLGSGRGLSTPSSTLSDDQIVLYGGAHVGQTRCGMAGVIITDQPVIEYQPQKPAAILYAGQSFSLVGMQAIGVAPVTYQWRKNGVNISGATSSSYSKSAIALTDSGNYDVVVANHYGSVTSVVVSLTINTPVAPFNVLVSPTVQTQYVKGSASISITAEGTTPFTYQWNKDGTAIGGATNSTFTLGSLSLTDSGTYTCVVGNGAGTTTSGNSVLAVLTPPTGYAGEVLTDKPLAYYRLNENAPLVSDVATNLGSLGTAGNAVHFPGLIHQVPGAIAGDADTAAYYTAIDPNSDDGAVPTIIPYSDGLNVIDSSASFTAELWLKPVLDGNGNAQCPIVNRYDLSSSRSGWDVWQRPSGTGWNFRMFNGSGSGKVFDITGGSYAVGTWNHLVLVYDGSIPSAAIYLNGKQVAYSDVPNGSYLPNYTGPMVIGGFSDGTSNPFIGPIDEVALYHQALTSAQILAHYNNGTNANRSASYSSLILADSPVEYLRLDEPAVNVAANSGNLGPSADGVYSNTGLGSGPQAPDFAGFDSVNPCPVFDGNISYVELKNPAALNFTGQITLEAWVQPDASQGGESYIIAHGGNDDWSGETCLRIENNAYQIVSDNGRAAYTIPAEDLGTGNWVHLAGTYDGGAWNLYRNGVLVATAADKVGPYLVNNANWAIGARGRWKYASGYPNSGLERQFKGLIDDAAIYNQALSADRIQEHYLAAKYGNNTPLTIATEPTVQSSYSGGKVTFSVGVQGGVPISYQWMKDGSAITGATNAVLTLTNVQATDAGSYSVVVSNPISTNNSTAALLVFLPGSVLADYGSVILADNPVVYYPLDELSGTVATNAATPGTLDGTYVGNPTLGVDGPSVFTGIGASFGSGQYVLLGNPDALNFSGQITIEAWINPTAFGGDHNVAEHGYTVSPSFAEVFLRIESSKYQVGVWNGDNYLAAADVPAEDANTWVYLVGTYDGANWNLYRNGELLNSSPATTGAIPVSGDWGIAAGTHSGDQRFFTGSLSQVAIYNHALSQDRVRSHYAASVNLVRPLSVTLSGGQPKLTWPTGTLQQSDTVDGTFTDVTGATSPYVPPVGASQKFYRIKF